MRRIILIAGFMMIAALSVAQELQTRNVVIVTLDGYRWREVFGGADKRILNKEKYVRDESVKEQFGGETIRERRKKLMPFFWSVISEEGQLYGNRKYDNGMRVTNLNLYSYSGYSEMFVGFVDDRIKNNDPIVNPNYTVFEVINKQPGFKNKVAAFSTWQTMSFILREEESGILVNSGADKATAKILSRGEKKLNSLTDHEKNPHGDRYDKHTFRYAMEYLKREHPRVLYISFDETDEHGHGGRYDEYLKSAHQADKMIGELWAWLQSQPQYKNKTTLIVTTDHGRGKSPRGWKRHAMLFRGSAQIWMAVIGPDTPASGEMKTFMRLEQNQIARTIAAFLNVPYEHPDRTVGGIIYSAFEEPELTEPEELASAASGN